MIVPAGERGTLRSDFHFANDVTGRVPPGEYMRKRARLRRPLKIDIIGSVRERVIGCFSSMSNPAQSARQPKAVFHDRQRF